MKKDLKSMKKQEKKINHYLQNIINDILFETLHIKWQGFDFHDFQMIKLFLTFIKRNNEVII